MYYILKYSKSPKSAEEEWDRFQKMRSTDILVKNQDVILEQLTEDLLANLIISSSMIPDSMYNFITVYDSKGEEVSGGSWLQIPGSNTITKVISGNEVRLAGHIIFKGEQHLFDVSYNNINKSVNSYYFPGQLEEAFEYVLNGC